MGQTPGGHSLTYVWTCVRLCDSDPKPTIDMDAMAFGMGCCCLQVSRGTLHVKDRDGD